VVARYKRVVVDIGTGSGSAVLRRAAREPETLFLALDADASAMADVSRRAARPARKGGRENVLFLAAAAEELPGTLAGIADETAVVLPWGSLLTAVLNPEGDTFEGVLATAKACGELTILVSAQERDQIAGTAPLDGTAAAALSSRYESCGLTVVERRPATRADVDRYSSGWGRRLAIPERRSAWLFRIRARADG
jgi:predicted RNA methylase